MIKAADEVQDLRRKIYAKARAEPHWRFWGLYVHVCKRERVLIRLALGMTWSSGTPAAIAH
jgi:RNA-directed DNA polymerase